MRGPTWFKCFWYKQNKMLKAFKLNTRFRGNPVISITEECLTCPKSLRKTAFFGQIKATDIEDLYVYLSLCVSPYIPLLSLSKAESLSLSLSKSSFWLAEENHERKRNFAQNEGQCTSLDLKREYMDATVFLLLVFFCFVPAEFRKWSCCACFEEGSLDFDDTFELITSACCFFPLFSSEYQ